MADNEAPAPEPKGFRFAVNPDETSGDNNGSNWLWVPDDFNLLWVPLALHVCFFVGLVAVLLRSPGLFTRRYVLAWPCLPLSRIPGLQP